MVVFRIDPARPRQASAQRRERLSDIGRNFNSGKKTRHCEALKSRRARGARSCNQLLDPRQNERHDSLNTCGARMQAIPLVQFGIGSNAVEVYVHGLRRKLGSDTIRTLRGVGYFIPK